MPQTAADLKTVLEAAGFEQIRSIPTDAVRAARREQQPRDGRRKFPERQLYVLVGVKSPAIAQDHQDVTLP